MNPKMETLELSKREVPITSDHISPRTQASPLRRNWRILAPCIGISLLTIIVPLYRMFLRLEIHYAEGWDVYTAAIAAHHQPLYPAPYSWTMVNYPILSFYTVAGLAHFTHDYLFTGRMLCFISFLICCALAGGIVWKLTRAAVPSVLVVFLALGIFCADAEPYVGANDPQMFAHAFALAGLFIYVSKRKHGRGLGPAALLFVLAGCAKPNLIDFPLAVLVDLWLTSRRDALRFCLFAVLFGGFAILLNIHLGGPYFVAQMLSGRSYSFSHMIDNFSDLYLPILPLALIALLTAIRVYRDSSLRIIPLLFWFAQLPCIAFGGGAGVWLNTYFSGVWATTLLFGILLNEVHRHPLQWPRQLRSSWFPAIVFLWLFVPLTVTGQERATDPNAPVHWSPIAAIRHLRTSEQQFDEEVAFLRAQPGPALCQSLLRCYYAGKPYVYDPFNATRMIRLGKLDPEEIVDRVQRHEYGAIQFGISLTPERWERPGQNDLAAILFAPPILKAIAENYVPALTNRDAEGRPVCVIYVPKR